MVRKLVLLVVIASLAAVLFIDRANVFGAFVHRADARESIATSSSSSTDRAANAIAPIDTLDGLRFATRAGDLNLTPYRGKIVYVNFFASWCPPCNAEAPMLAALARTYAAKGLIVVGVDEGEGAPQAIGFQKKYDLPYPLALDPSGSAGAPFGAEALPTQVFFDRHGAIAYKQVGEIDEETATATIESLLATK